MNFKQNQFFHLLYYVQLFSVLYLLLLVYMFLFFFPCLPRGNVITLLTWNLWIIVLWIRKSKSSICIPTSWKSARRKRVYAKGKSERCGVCKKNEKEEVEVEGSFCSCKYLIPAKLAWLNRRNVKCVWNSLVVNGIGRRRKEGQ